MIEYQTKNRGNVMEDRNIEVDQQYPIISEESKGNTTSRSKRDRTCLSDSYLSDIDDADHISKRILLNLEGLSLHSSNHHHTKKSTNNHNDRDVPIPTVESRVIDDIDDMDQSASSSFLSSHKRYLSKTDQLVENIIRKSRRMSENRHNTMDMMDNLVPSSVGPHPGTDMLLSSSHTWPSVTSQLAVIVPTVNHTIQHPYSSSTSHHRRSLNTIDEEEDDDISELTAIWPLMKHRHTNSDIPRLSGDNTHAGIIEVVSDTSESAEELSSLMSMKTQDSVDSTGMSMDIDGQSSNDSTIVHTACDRSSTSTISDDSEDDDDVIDFLTIS